MVVRLRIWVILVGACLASLPAGASAGTRSAELKGVVLVAPTEPICMPRVPCMRPAAGAVLAFTQRDRILARATTAVDGSYRVLLRPGRYGIRVTRPATRRVNPQQVTVYAGRIRRVNIYIDSGIR